MPPRLLSMLFSACCAMVAIGVNAQIPTFNSSTSELTLPGVVVDGAISYSGVDVTIKTFGPITTSGATSATRPDYTTSDHIILLPLVNADGVLYRNVSAQLLSFDVNAYTTRTTASPFSGTWTGNFSGSDSGSASILVDRFGYAYGTGSSNNLGGNFIIYGQVAANGSLSLTGQGGTTTGAVFSGNLNASSKAGGGSWSLRGAAGNWTIYKQ